MMEWIITHIFQAVTAQHVPFLLNWHRQALPIQTKSAYALTGLDRRLPYPVLEIFP
jgi:hypothetical protein